MAKKCGNHIIVDRLFVLGLITLMDSKSDVASALGMMRAKTGAPSGGSGSGGQFPGMRVYRRSRWVRGKGFVGKANCFHVMSRIVDGLEHFSDEDREALVVLLFKMARFCRVKVLTYCVMGNHFHALIEVPDGEKVREYFRDEKVGWERLYGHLSCLYSKGYLAMLRRQVESFLEAGRVAEAEEIREAFLLRIGDLSRFMWELKERYTKWYNKVHGRRGALWMGRFKSVLVQGNEKAQDADGGYSQALRTMAAYIDLNPVRAGWVQDPADYRWCGYAAAVVGSKRSRRGLNRVMGSGVDRWEEDGTHDCYRQLLMRHGLDAATAGPVIDGKKRRGVPEPQRQEELKRLRAKIAQQPPRQVSVADSKASAEPTRSEADWEEGVDFARKGHRGMLRGYALGEQDWVERVFEENRESFGAKRKRGGRKLGLGKLYALRQVKRE